MSKPKPVPRRIAVSEALAHLKPFMSRSTFYNKETGPRWLMVDELDIRLGPPLNMDRKLFSKWLTSLEGDRANGPAPMADRLRKSR